MNNELKGEQQHYECIVDDQQSSTIGAAEIEAHVLPRLRSAMQLQVAGAIPL